MDESGQTTFSNEIRKLPMGLVWPVAVLGALTLIGAFNPFEALESALENQGLGTDEATAGGFIAGYTFPLTFAVGGLILAGLQGWFDGVSPPGAWVTIGLTLLAATWLAGQLGLGAVPSEFYPVQGNPMISFTLSMIASYFTAYGFPLFLSSLLLGTAAGLQLDRWMSPTPAVG